jgi:hypothetical protein
MPLVVHPSSYIGSTVKHKQPVEDLHADQKLSEFYNETEQDFDTDYFEDDSEVSTVESVIDLESIEDKSQSSPSPSPTPLATDFEKTSLASLNGIFNHRIILLFGGIILVLFLSYLYWIDKACSVPENDETNLTLQYAIDKTRTLQDKDILGKKLV